MHTEHKTECYFMH